MATQEAPVTKERLDGVAKELQEVAAELRSIRLDLGRLGVLEDEDEREEAPAA